VLWLTAANNSTVADVAPTAAGSAMNQLLGIKGASAETVGVEDGFLWCMNSFLTFLCFGFLTSPYIGLLVSIIRALFLFFWETEELRGDAE